MKILHISYADNGGATYFFKEAVRAHSDHEVRSIRMKQNYLDYATDIFAPSPAEIAGWYNWADVLHIHDNAHHILDPGLPLKPTLMHYHGTFYRRSPKACHLHCAERGWYVAVSTVDLSLFGKLWIPTPRPQMRSHRAAGTFIVTHAPTVRNVKNTPEVLSSLDGVDGIEMLLIENAAYAQCIKLKSRAHLLVDQFILGYGNNAVEFWAMGGPVIANALGDVPMAADTLYGLKADDILDKMRAQIGYLPFFQSKLDDLAGNVARMRDDRGLWNEWAERGWQFWQDFHSPAAVIKRLIPMYEAAIGLAATAQRDTVGRWGKVAPVARRRDEIITDGGSLLRFLGGNRGKVTWWPETSSRRYEFSAVEPIRSVHETDAPWFLSLRDKRKRPLFERVK